MARKPIHLEHTGLRAPRDRMWAGMKTLVEFTPTDIEDKAHPITRGSVRDYLECLLKAGYVRLVAEQAKNAVGKFGPMRYQVVKFAAFTPQLDEDGQPLKPHIGVTAMWRAMKVRKTFDAATVAADATQGSVVCTLNTAKTYCTHLERAGYLAVAKAARNSGGLTVYRLVRDTGPLPPAVTRAKVVYDRNTGVLHTVATAQEVCDAVA